MSSPELSSGDGSPVTLLSLAAALLRHVRLLVLGVLLGATVAAAWALLATEQYSSVTIFAPGDQPANTISSGLAALGSQFGASFDLNEGTRSLQFYAELLKSHDLLAAVATDSFPDPARPGVRAPLSALLDLGGESPARSLENTVDYLQDDAVHVTINDRTGMITMAVVLPDPGLAAAVANRLYHRLETFNTNIRQSSATNRRRFAERELGVARATLESAEAEMRGFLERNRGGQDVPRLTLERARLQRRIDVAQIAFSQMTQEFTEARIAEARDTPTFTVIQTAAPPLDRSYPARTRMTIMGAILGGCLAALLIATLATAGTARELDPSGADAVRHAWRAARSSGTAPAPARPE